MKIASYGEAIKYLESFIGKIRFEITPEFIKEHDPLDRMRTLLSLLGNPQNKFSSVLVGGTSGKSSTTYLISHVLTNASYKTGLTLSPHLQRINERIQINGEQISDTNFIELTNLVVQTITHMQKMPVGSPSYFEILIAMAFLYFAQQKVDIAVVEVGMGGEFDATNTLYPLVAVLTNVSLDHTSILGGTVQKIAKTKAGIIKKIEDLRFKIYESSKNHKSSFINHKSIVITGVKQPSVIKIIEDRCKEVGAKLYRLRKDFDFKIKIESLKGSVFDLSIAHGREWNLNDLRLSFLGKYQVENASLAIDTVLQLKKFGFSVSEEHIRQALKTAFFPGRFEIIPIALRSLRQFGDSSDPNLKQSVSLARANASKYDAKDLLFKSAPHAKAPRAIILDGAHNPTKMKEFLKSLKKIFPTQNPTSPRLRGAKKVFIVGFKFDKDIPKMLREITKLADEIIVTEFNRATDMVVSASADALKIKDQILKIKYGRDVIVEEDSGKALKKALAIQQFSNSTIIVVTGSLYLVGEIRSSLVLKKNG